MIQSSHISAPTPCCSQMITIISFIGNNTWAHLFKPHCCCCSCSRTDLFFASAGPELRTGQCRVTGGNGAWPQLCSSWSECRGAPINEGSQPRHSIQGSIPEQQQWRAAAPGVTFETKRGCCHSICSLAQLRCTCTVSSSVGFPEGELVPTCK